ncbi:MAG: pyruvate, phosphate dikinase [Planctomycetes bacterium]|nr:pyruvate, phosphate dikinase [Planctomycetota bacterium]
MKRPPARRTTKARSTKARTAVSPARRGSTARTPQYVYPFGPNGADGDRHQKDLLGGKGANLAEMCNLGLPVPPGFTLSTEVCSYYYANRRTYPKTLEREVEKALAQVEREVKKKLGDKRDPLLVSVRSGARVSMPGMMDTVLNLGLNDATVAGLARASGNPRFAWDAYRRFVNMYADVVLGLKAKSDSHHEPFREAFEAKKKSRGVREDSDLGVDDLMELVKEYKAIVLERTGSAFPDDPREQLWGAIGAVFRSWNNERAVAYRSMNHISSAWGTAVSVCSMVFGNLGPDSGTGVAFTRDPSTGEKRFYGEYLMNAQGEDVVAGLRTPHPISTLATGAPAAWKELNRIVQLLEKHYRDMQDIEFTIERGRLWMLQCRNGKRTGFAAVKIAVDLVSEKLITQDEAIMRVPPTALDQLLQPVFIPAELEAARKDGRLLTKALNAGPGAASGRIAFSPTEAVARRERGENVVLVRVETSPDDILGMEASAGILTARGGMTSHAALVARQMGKVCVAGAGDLEIDYSHRSLTVGSWMLSEGDWISIDGSSGEVYAGKLGTQSSDVCSVLLEGAQPGPNSIYRSFDKLLSWADARRTLRVRANADQPDQCKNAVAFGAEGVGLCRTEHMFFAPGKIEAVREMILADKTADRVHALKKLLPLQRADFEGIFRAMAPRPVTIRSLDPPLHEFLPHDEPSIWAVARDLGVAPERVHAKVEALREQNPMLGLRGCRLGIVYPEITIMQARAIFQAACQVAKDTKKKPSLEIMIPLVGTRRELELQADVVRTVAEEVFAEMKIKVPFLVGTMIELPRAALTAGEIALAADFFSFGTNDLTQTTFGISRDDGGKFLPHYIEAEIHADDPFATLDREGVGRLMEIATREGRAAKPGLKIGICGEHGGDPRSIEFCNELGMDYVSCSPYRVPLARLAAAQAALRGA